MHVHIYTSCVLIRTFDVACSRGLAVASLGVHGPIYALGGLDDNTCYSTVERYDAESNSWSQVQDMNFPRGGVAVASINVSRR